MTRGRILFVSTSIARGGAERQVVDLATALRARGWTVAVLSMIAPTDHQAELAAAGIELQSLDMTRGRPSVAALARYARFLRRWRPTLVHAHMVHANLLVRIGRLVVPSVPVVCTVHNVVEGSRWREIAYRLTDPLASATTAVSAAATERYVRVGAAPRGRIVTIPNGIDLARVASSPATRVATRRDLQVRNAFLWLNVARLMPAKGQEMLLHAFADVAHVHPAARLAIAGDGPQRDALLALVRKLGLVDRVALLGERRDVAALLGAADGFVLSSLWEGMPIVLLEAAAHGLPIVSTDVGGCAEAVPPGTGAVLTIPQPADLARGMLSVMALTDHERASVGRRLRAHVESLFNLPTIVDRWEGLYASAIADERVRRATLHPPPS